MNQGDVERFFSLRNEYRSIRYDLQNMEVLCEVLGHPQRSFRSVLIAGTNGKGSVARFISAMMSDAGLYVSPHLERLTERISIGGREIASADLDEAFEAVRQACQDAKTQLLYPPTYFEQMTAMAFWHFRNRTTHAVIEVGLGGRLDATNVVRQDVSVITNIGWDHQEYLGSTLAEIAEEKAGIIDDYEPVVTGPGCDFDAIRERAGPRLVAAGMGRVEARSIGDGYYEVDLQTAVRTYSRLRPRLRGRHQIDNLGVAVAAAECLEASGWPIDSRTIVEGANSATWPGRLERISGAPDFLLDGAHNPQAAEALAHFLAAHHPSGVCLIFGAMEEKDCRSLLEILMPHTNHLILTRPSNNRAADPNLFEPLYPGSVIAETLDRAIGLARQQSVAGETVLVAGSLYLVGEARRILIDRAESLGGVASNAVAPDFTVL